MHAYDIMLIVAITSMIGFSAVIYVDDDLVLALGFVAAAVVGSPLGGWLFWRYVPMHDQFAVIIGALLGGVGLVLVVRRLRRRCLQQ